jgi:hypothetical protein
MFDNSSKVCAVSCCAVPCHPLRSATKSYITSLCLEKFLDNTSDLVFVEFIANDGSEMDLSYTENQKARFFERFLRKILNKSSAPAVVMMQVSSSSNSRAQCPEEFDWVGDNRRVWMAGCQFEPGGVVDDGGRGASPRQRRLQVCWHDGK